MVAVMLAGTSPPGPGVKASAPGGWENAACPGLGGGALTGLRSPCLRRGIWVGAAQKLGDQAQNMLM